MDAGQYPRGGAESGGGDSPVNNKMIRMDPLYRKLTGFIGETQVLKAVQARLIAFYAAARARSNENNLPYGR